MGPHHTLKTSYFNPESSGSFGGVERLRRVTGANRAEVKNFLQTQDTYTLHKPVRKKFQRRRVIAGGLNHQHQIDLVDVQNFKKDNDNISYLLTGIDVFSKYAYVVPLKNKSSGTLLEVFKKLFPQNKNNPLFIQTDLGTEFTNKKVQNYLKKVGIIFFTSHNQDIKASIIERFNRTLKERIYRYITKNRTRRFLDILQSLVKSYNNTYHRSIKQIPSKVNISNQENVWDALYNNNLTTTETQDNIEVGSRVRISKVKTLFEKGYLPNWTSELFTVSEVIRTRPLTYKLKDDNGEEIEGSFYFYELQKVGEKKVYLISKILNQRKRRGEKEYLIQWYGYPSSFDSWIPARNIQQYE